MSEVQQEVVIADGYAAGSLDGIGQGPGFRKVRSALDVKEMGVNAIVLPPNVGGSAHWHERQEEVYFVHAGTVEFTLGENDEHTVVLGPGGLLRVDAATPRMAMNVGDDEATYIIFGAEGGYVGRDGKGRPGEERIRIRET
jgi:mannose-6-phosphate isomerase-like protein (cupin superfamily)